MTLQDFDVHQPHEFRRAPTRPIDEAPASVEPGSALTRASITDAILRKCPHLARSEAQSILNDVLDEIVDTLTSGEGVRLHGFGRFSVRSKNARVGRNPKTRVEAPICARRVVTFKASRTLVRDINDMTDRHCDDGAARANLFEAEKQIS